jgi:hypothetical protein
MLVAAFEVEVGGGPQFLALLADRCVTYPGIEPDIENILFLLEVVRAAL